MARAENEALVRQIFDAFAEKRASRCATSSPTDATWIVPGSGTMAGTFVGREEIFGFLGRLPKETDGTYSSALIDVLASEDRAAALYRASGSARAPLELDQVLLFRIEDGLVQRCSRSRATRPRSRAFWGLMSRARLQPLRRDHVRLLRHADRLGAGHPERAPARARAARHRR